MALGWERVTSTRCGGAFFRDFDDDQPYQRGRMIVVDSSVWIAKLRGQPSAAVSKLDTVHNLSSIVLGDSFLLELLQGARDDHDAAEDRTQFEIVRGGSDGRSAHPRAGAATHISYA